MARRKVHHGYISNPAARKASLRKRKQHILKKVEELTILCGIDGCGIIYSPDEPEPTFWPSQLEVEYMLRKYESKPDIEKISKKINLEAYVRENVKKLEKQVKNLESMNREMENSHFLNQIYRAGKRFEEFQQAELIDLKGYVEERRSVLGMRMKIRDISICGEINEPMPDEEPETGIEDEDPAIEEWFINMTNETQYEVSSSNNNVPETQKALDDVLDHAAMSTDQCNGINQDSSMFGVNPGQNGVNVATSYHIVEFYNGNPQGINNELGGNNQVAEGAENSNAAMFPDHGNTQISAVSYGFSVVGQEIYVDAAVSEDNVVGGGSGINEINQLPHQDPSTFKVNNHGELGHSSYHAMEIYNENPDEAINDGNGGGGNNELGVADNINAAVFPHGNTQGRDILYGGQGSVNIDGSIKKNDHHSGNGGAEHGRLPNNGLTEGSHHGILDFPNNNSMFSATLLSSNSMDVDQPNLVSYATYYDINGANDGENLAQQQGNQNKY